MILIDTSALFAVLQGEPEAELFLETFLSNDLCLPASVLVEAGITATVRGSIRHLQSLVDSLDADVAALDEPIASLATDAFRRYGKGRHKANLNFGDCLVYATAKHLRLPLLYKGDDFIHTDVKSALPSRH